MSSALFTQLAPAPDRSTRVFFHAPDTWVRGTRGSLSEFLGSGKDGQLGLRLGWGLLILLVQEGSPAPDLGPGKFSKPRLAFPLC